MMIIDQTWVDSWMKGVPSMPEVLQTREWIRKLPKNVQEIATRFPPRCLVKSKTFSIEVPYMFSLGYLDAYHADGTVTVCQSPDGPSAIVKLEDISFVAPWKGLSPTQVQSFLGCAQPSP